MGDAEILDATAFAIKILGEGALETSAEQLVTLSLDLAVEHLSVPSLRLMAVADALSRADSAGRSGAVLELLNAAAALEESLGVDLHALRGGALELARACCEHREAARGIAMRLAAAGREEQDDEEHPGYWWWLLLRGKKSVQQRRFESSEMTLNGALLVKEDAHPPPQGTHDSAMIKCLEKESRRRERYLPLARSIQEFADDLGVPHPDLTRATDALEGAGDVNTAVAELGTAATELEREATARLRAPVAQLAQACREHQRAAAAMEAVQRAAEERARQRESAAVAVQIEWPPALAADQGNEWSSGCSAMQGTALLGALTMLPYMGGPDHGDGLLKSTVCTCRRNVGIAFAWMWCIVGAGVPCLMARRPLLHRVARLLSRVGMLAATLLVIFYCHWSLAPDWTEGVWLLSGVAIILHAVLLGLACYDGDL